MASTTMAFTNQKTESLFERHAWKVLLGFSCIILLFGVGDLLNGAADLQAGESVLVRSVARTTWNELQSSRPYVANLIDLRTRTQAADMIALGALSSAVCLFGYRRGERWAWFTMWMLPFLLALLVSLNWTADRQPGIGTPAPIISGSIFFVLSVLILALSYRKFFHSVSTASR